jgi:general secretion pathway protein L
MNVKDLLNTDVEVARQWLRLGYHWWLDELLQLVPLRWKQRLVRKRSLIANTDGDHISVTTPNGDIVDLTTLPVSQRKLDVVLSPSLVLTRIVDTPLMRIADVLKMVALEIDRLTPFAPGTAFFDAEIVHRNEAASTQKVRIGVLPRPTADRVMADLTKAGIVPLSLRVSGVVAGSTGEFDFLGSVREARGERSAASRARILWLIVAVLFVFNIAALVIRDVSQLQTLRDITVSQSNIVVLARRLREKVDIETASRTALVQRRAQTSPLRVLDEVTRALPLTAWIQRFEWDGARLHIAGYGPSTAAVMQALRKSPSLRRARSSTGMTEAKQGSADSQEPFDILIDVQRVAP